MDTELLVDLRIDDGRKLIAQLVRDNFDVAVAFWVATNEEGFRRLFIGSNAVKEDRSEYPFGVVYASLQKISDNSLSLGDVKLIPASDPMALEAIAIRNRYPGRMPIRFRGKRLGNLSIEEAYIYPNASGRMDSREIMQTVVGLMNRTGPLQPSIITLKDGSEIRAIPRGVNMNTPGEIQIVLQDITSGNERIVSANEVMNIQ